MLNIPQYFEEFEPGYKLETASRTVTESDIVNFAGIGGNFHPIHVDSECGKKTPFKNKIAHGLLVISILEGLIERTRIIDKILAFTGIKELNFLNPVFAGDTVSGQLEVSSKRELPGKPAGELVLNMKAKNQTGKTVAAGVFTILVAKKS